MDLAHTTSRLLGATLAFLLVAPVAALAEGTSTIAAPPAVTTPAAEVPAEAPKAEEAPAQAPAEPAPATTPEPAPQVQGAHPQHTTGGGTRESSSTQAKGQTGGAPAKETGQVRAKHKAAAPGSLTPALPLALQGGVGGVPNLFIENFEVPPFLLPVFQAAGAAYGVPWQVLAAINEVETDYGRDLSVSSAGAEGWMQFLPSSWSGYGVDANGDGYRDPYNPADAIFAAARYLRAAGGDRNIRAAVFSYNHSQAYVSSVMLRAQLLGATPAELLGAITGLTEARFPVHAAAHFSDGFPTVHTSSGTVRQVVGTAIYAAEGAPVIAAQDGQVLQIGQSPTLGRFVSLRDAYGNTYVYADLGSVAHEYPVIEPRVNSTVSAQIERAGAPAEPAPSGPATAGVQPRSPLSEAGTVSGLALGAAAALESTAAAAAPAAEQPAATQPQTVAPNVRAFREGSSEVYLHMLKPGVQVIAGTVLGHVGPATATGEAPHIIFQIRPAGPGAPLIDPKPILDGWVSLENSSVFHAKGENPFLATSPTVGQVLLESKQQLEPQVLRDAGIRLSRCGRQDIRAGRVDKRVLAALEYLSVSGLRPTVGGLSCPPATPAALASNAAAGTTDETIEITAVNGVPVAGHQSAGSAADTLVRRLLMLQGLSRPHRIVSDMSYPGAAATVTSAKAVAAIRVQFAAPRGGLARIAGLYGTALSPTEWSRLIARLGEIPDPTVSSKPSTAAIPDVKEAGGNH
ncbi:MAG TPA: lytic murein transglycosylase [Solirubrobacteraceae bacterium]|nr:lytic murein transglycosylase [Solirubrobacteraceae bacterium]